MTQADKNILYVAISIFFVVIYTLGKFSFESTFLCALGLMGTIATIIVYTLNRYNYVRTNYIFIFSLLFFTIIGIFMHFGGLNPIENPNKDWILYHNSGQEVKNLLTEGPLFSNLLDSFFQYRFFSLLVGILYTITLPGPEATILLNSLLSATTIILLYAISRSVGVTKKSATLVAIIGSLYPSFIIFSNMPLKEALVLAISFGALLALLQTIKSIANRWLLLIPFLISIPLYTLREPFWYALLGAVTVTILLWWTHTSKIIRLGITLLFLVTASFSPVLFGDAYVGTNKLSLFANKERVTYYREVVFTKEHREKGKGSRSTLTQKTELDKPTSFIKNYMSSLKTVFLGPLPDQVQGKQKLALFESMFWYLLILGISVGTIRAIKKHNPALILTLFSLAILSVLALYIPNLGIIVRLRIGPFLLLLPTLGLFFDSTPWIYKMISNLSSKKNT